MSVHYMFRCLEEPSTQSYWIYGLCPSSGILNTRKQNVLETGSVSVFTRGEGDTSYIGSFREKANLIRSQGPNRLGVSLPTTIGRKQTQFP
jgi:hypothetical protein